MSRAALDSALWYLGRATGLVSLILLTIVVVLGIVTRSGRPLPGLPRFAVTAVHRSSSLLAVCLLAVHIVTLTLDPQAQLRWLDAVVPLGGRFRPAWIGLGAFATDLLIALVGTSLLRHRVGRRTWRALHWTAYAAWPLALGHTLGSGTDVGRSWLLAPLVICWAAVLAAVGWRCSAGFLDGSTRLPSSRRPRAPRRGPSGPGRRPGPGRRESSPARRETSPPRPAAGVTRTRLDPPRPAGGRTRTRLGVPRLETGASGTQLGAPRPETGPAGAWPR